MEEEYEIKSPHEKNLEEPESDTLSQRIALMTAIIATVGALISYASGNAQTEAMFLKNQSILKQALASDQWSLFEAKSIKSHIDQSAAALSVDELIKARFLADVLRQDREKKEVKVEATKLAHESQMLSEESEKKLRPHERLALALTLIQIAIALAAITILTKRKWLLWASILSAGTGVIVALSACFL